MENNDYYIVELLEVVGVLSGIVFIVVLSQ
jgi:hypothetical protein